MIAETITAKNRPEAIEPYDKTWGVGVSGLDEDISPFPRVNRMLSKTKALFVSKVDTERARIMTESWLEKHKGEPALKRVANCFYDIISQVEIHIEEDELIVGEVGAAAWTAPLYPEFSTWLADELDQIDRGEVPDFIDRHNDKYIITDDQRKIIRELWAKWKGVNQGEMIRAEMHPEAKKGSGYIFANDLYTNNGIGHVTADYPKLMKLGYGGLRKLVEAKLAEIKLGDDGDELLKYEFWTAQLISLDAAELYFKRYGALAEKLAEKLDATAVVTTATDVRGKFAVDAWAARHGCAISDMGLAKAVSAAILEGDVPLCSQFYLPVPLPEGTFAGETGPLGIFIGWHVRTPFARTLRLIPRVLRVGVGCRRGISAEAVVRAVQTVFAENGLDTAAIRGVCSIDLKQDEPGLLAACEKNNWPVHFYTAQQLRDVAGDFTPSDFVRSVTGVDNVCERAALLDAERLIVQKTARDGVTVAVAAEHWEVRFG